MAVYSFKNIIKLANDLGIQDQYVIPYGWDKAKIDLTAEDFKNKKDGKLVLVTAITPTKAGEGKTTTTIGLHDVPLTGSIMTMPGLPKEPLACKM